MKTMPTGIATTRCGMTTSTYTLQAIRTRTMPMGIPVGKQTGYEQKDPSGTPIRMGTNPLPTPIPISAMRIIDISIKAAALHAHCLSD